MVFSPDQPKGKKLSGQTESSLDVRAHQAANRARGKVPRLTTSADRIGATPSPRNCLANRAACASAASGRAPQTQKLSYGRWSGARQTKGAGQDSKLRARRSRSTVNARCQRRTNRGRSGSTLRWRPAFRDECLNDHYFNNLAHARSLIGAWRRDYNEARPHSSSGRIPPRGVRCTAPFVFRPRAELTIV